MEGLEMAPDSFETIENMYMKAKPSEKDKYLFKALQILQSTTLKKIEGLHDKMIMGFENVNKQIIMIDKKCPFRQGLCEERFKITEDKFTKQVENKANCFKLREKGYITRKQAFVAGIIIVAFSAGVSLGTGAISAWEVVKAAAKVSIP